MAGAEGHAGAAHDRGVRLRVRYTKTGKVRFTGHRDVVRLWERAMRRSGLPVAWSEGFSPRPLISFGLALPTGAESLAEYLDVVLDERRATAGPEGSVERPGLAELLSSLLPEGLDVTAVAALPMGSGSLQHEVSSCSWELEVLGLPQEVLRTRVEQVLAAPKLLVRRERKGRAADDDLRPALLALAVTGLGAPAEATARGTVGLSAELATRPRGVRPQELLQGLGSELSLARARRIHQWIERDGARWEPLAATAPSAALVPHAGERAS